MFPNVEITLGNGALGAVAASSDGVAGMVLSGVGTVAIPLATPKRVYSMAMVEALGITLASHPSAYRQISEFYEGYKFITGSDIAELYIMIVTDTVTMTDMADIAHLSSAKLMLDYAAGRIRHLGITRYPPLAYVPTITKGIDPDVLTAIPKAQALATAYTVLQAPLRVMIEGRDFSFAAIGDTTDLKTLNANRVSVVIWNTESGKAASVGYTLGVKAALPVQRKISRVKNGALQLATPYNGELPVNMAPLMETAHNKGYIGLRQFPGRTGYYFTGEPTCVTDADDYAILSRGHVIDKALRIAYDTFVSELEDDIEVNAEGQLLEGYRLYLDNKIITAIASQMVGEISAEPLFGILPDQNIIADATTKAVLKIIPKGYQSYIKIDLGFTNPAL